MSISLVLSMLLALLVGAFLTGAFFEPAFAGDSVLPGSDALRALYDSKERSLRAIKDLELDYSMGKISPEDFERSKQELSLEVAVILDEIRRHEQR